MTTFGAGTARRHHHDPPETSPRPEPGARQPHTFSHPGATASWTDSLDWIDVAGTLRQAAVGDHTKVISVSLDQMVFNG
ncbi:hypothetical protein [Pseudarthrobacter oxydans]|uniref:hypothetical protein n=1 Tax=Pseudarthrobacter oxydans TaxID=1671 RepID=UPI0037FAF419